MANMVRLSLNLEPEDLERIEKFTRGYELSTRNSALRMLIRLGLDEAERRPENEDDL